MSASWVLPSVTSLTGLSVSIRYEQILQGIYLNCFDITSFLIVKLSTSVYLFCFIFLYNWNKNAPCHKDPYPFCHIGNFSGAN